MAAYEVLLLNTAIPQIQAAQSGDTYVVPRDIAFSTVANLANGTNLLPSLTFSSDTNTGIYREGADALGFTAGGGTNQMVLTSTGLGVGTNNPAYKLDVNTGQIRAQESGTGSGDGSLIGATVSANGNAGVLFQTNSVSRWNLTTQGTAGANLRIYNYTLGTTVATFDPSGNLGLGITPSAWAASAIDVAGWASFAQRNTNGWTLVGGNVYWDGSNYKYKNSSTAALYELRGPTGVHAWLTAPSGTAGNTISFTQAMTLDLSGRLLVKATSNTGTNTKLAVGAGLTSGNAVAYISTEDVDVDGVQISNWTGSATTNRVSLGFDSSGVGGFRIGIPGGVNAFQIYDSVAATERARISSDGTFRVKGAGTAGSTDAVQFSGSAPASAMTLDSSGNLLVGETSSNSGNNGLKVKGQFALTTSQAFTASGSVNDSAYYIVCYSLSATCTLTLPTPANNTGRLLNIVVQSAQQVVSASSNVTAITNGALGTAILPATAGKWAQLWCDGTYWNIIATNV